mmetsp:Transcript_101985/g.292640  ORF Transcript_101985/g.292640 Transcript_101985/m.292640 type:complete len:291 (-) Transcript_101985:367-1239(-)
MAQAHGRFELSVKTPRFEGDLALPLVFSCHPLNTILLNSHLRNCRRRLPQPHPGFARGSRGRTAVSRPASSPPHPPPAEGCRPWSARPAAGPPTSSEASRARRTRRPARASDSPRGRTARRSGRRRAADRGRQRGQPGSSEQPSLREAARLLPRRQGAAAAAPRTLGAQPSPRRGARAPSVGAAGASCPLSTAGAASPKCCAAPELAGLPSAPGPPRPKLPASILQPLRHAGSLPSYRRGPPRSPAAQAPRASARPPPERPPLHVHIPQPALRNTSVLPPLPGLPPPLPW